MNRNLFLLALIMLGVTTSAYAWRVGEVVNNSGYQVMVGTDNIGGRAPGVRPSRPHGEVFYFEPYTQVTFNKQLSDTHRVVVSTHTGLKSFRPELDESIVNISIQQDGSVMVQQNGQRPLQLMPQPFKRAPRFAVMPPSEEAIVPETPIQLAPPPTERLKRARRRLDLTGSDGENSPPPPGR